MLLFPSSSNSWERSHDYNVWPSQWKEKLVGEYLSLSKITGLWSSLFPHISFRKYWAAELRAVAKAGAVTSFRCVTVIIATRRSIKHPSYSIHTAAIPPDWIMSWDVFRTLCPGTFKEPSFSCPRIQPWQMVLYVLHPPTNVFQGLPVLRYFLIQQLQKVAAWTSSAEFCF